MFRTTLPGPRQLGGAHAFVATFATTIPVAVEKENEYFPLGRRVRNGLVAANATRPATVLFPDAK